MIVSKGYWGFIFIGVELIRFLMKSCKPTYEIRQAGRIRIWHARLPGMPKLQIHQEHLKHETRIKDSTCSLNSQISETWNHIRQPLYEKHPLTLFKTWKRGGLMQDLKIIERRVSNQIWWSSGFWDIGIVWVTIRDFQLNFCKNEVKICSSTIINPPCLPSNPADLRSNESLPCALSSVVVGMICLLQQVSDQGWWGGQVTD